MTKRLVTTDHPPDGFTTLWERDRLDPIEEAQVIQDLLHILFTDAEREAANEGLAQCGYAPST